MGGHGGFGSQWNGDRTFETEYERDDSTPITVAIVRALAAIEGTEPTKVRFRLYDSVDPDALDSLFGLRETSHVSVEFTVSSYAVYKIIVRGDGQIAIQERTRGVSGAQD